MTIKNPNTIKRDLATVSIAVALAFGSVPTGTAHANTLFNDLWDFDDDSLEFDAPEVAIRTVDNSVCADLLPDESAELVESCSCVGQDLTVSFPVGSGISEGNPACRISTPDSSDSSSPDLTANNANTALDVLRSTSYARTFTAGLPTTEALMASIISEGLRDYYNSLYGSAARRYGPSNRASTSEFPSSFFIRHRQSNGFAGRVTLEDLRRTSANRSHLLAHNNDGRQAAEQFGVPNLAFDTRFNAWIDGSYTIFDDDRSGNEGDGGSGRVTLGASYRLADTIAIGGETLYRFSDSDRDDGSVSSESGGFGGAIFATFLLPHQLLFTPLVAYEQIDTDLTQSSGVTSLTGSFESDIWTFGGQLTTQFDAISDDGRALYWLRPAVSTSYATANRGAFTRSDGVAITGDTLDQGTMTVGVRAGAAFFRPDHTIPIIEPSIGLNGIWNYQTIDDQTVSGGAVIAAPEAFASVTAALAATFSGGAKARFSTTYSGLGSDVTGLTLSGQLTIPFGGR